MATGLVRIARPARGTGRAARRRCWHEGQPGRQRVLFRRFRHEFEGAGGFAGTQDHHQIRERERREFAGEEVADLERGLVLSEEELEFGGHLLGQRGTGIRASARAATTTPLHNRGNVPTLGRPLLFPATQEGGAA